MEKEDGLEGRFNGNGRGIHLDDIFRQRYRRLGYFPTEEQIDDSVQSYHVLAPNDGRYSERVIMEIVDRTCAPNPIKLPRWAISIIDYIVDALD